MNKKLFAVVSFMLLFTSIVPLAASQDSMDDVDVTIYVDDDNVEGPWDGTYDHPYRFIQDAVNVSEKDSIIFVCNGVYYEHILLTQTVSLIGENKETTIIDGSSSSGVIKIQGGDNIFIKNFTIQNGIDETETSGWGILTESTEFLVVSDTIITNNEDGIIIGENSKNCMILSSAIMDNDVGVGIYNSSANLIYSNTINDNNVNVMLYQSKDNLIANNNIYGGKKNAYFFNSYDQFDGNYWGVSGWIHLIAGLMEIPSLGFVIPWIKFDVNPLDSIDAFERNPMARMKTSKGTMIIEMYQSKMPITVNNFIRLSDIDFFEQLVFHRVIDDFVIQGGGYYANGTHKESPFGTIELEIHPDVTHVDGAISMARTSDPNSATSQFFICDGPQHRLDGNYSAFGRVIVGIDVLRSIASVETKTKHGFMRDWPVDEVVIEQVDIFYT